MSEINTDNCIAIQRSTVPGKLPSLGPFHIWPDTSIAQFCAIAQKHEYTMGQQIALKVLGKKQIILLEQGVIELNVTIANGRQQVIGYIHPGSVVGLSHAYSFGPAAESHEFLANTAVVARQLSAQRFKELMWAHRPIADTVLSILATRAGVLLDTVANSSLLSAEQRIARSLAPSNFDPSTSNGQTLPQNPQFSITQTDLARTLGLSRQSVGTALRSFARSGLIKIGRERIEVLSPDGLMEVVNGANAEIVSPA